MPKRLTDVAVQRLTIPLKGSEPRLIFDSRATGLAIKITPTGKRVWVGWFPFPGHKYQSARTLGYFPAMGVEAARAKAGEWHNLVRQGIDPKAVEAEQQAKAEAARRAEAALRDNTFERYCEDHYIPAKTNRRAKEDAAEIRRHLIPHWGNRPLHDIAPRDVRELFAALIARAPYVATSIWTHCSGIFKSAVHDEIIHVSPVASLSKKIIFKNAGITSRQRTFSDDELFAFWRATSRLGGYPWTPFYRLLLLTAVRLNELLKAQWTEFHPELRRVLRDAARIGERVDWNAVPPNVKTWTVPRERFKSDAEHMVMLSDEACRLLETLPRFGSGAFLFTATGHSPIWRQSKVKNDLDRYMLRTLRALSRRRGDDSAQVKLQPWKQHDLRRVVRTNLSALDVPDHIAEMVLGHGRKGVQRVYDAHRYEKQIRAALEQWSSHLRSIVQLVADVTGRPKPDNVVALLKAG